MASGYCCLDAMRTAGVESEQRHAHASDPRRKAGQVSYVPWDLVAAPAATVPELPAGDSEGGERMSRHEQSIDGMARWGDDYERRCVAILGEFRKRGISDAKAGLPMRRTFEHLGGPYCSAEGSAYERGYRSILSPEQEAEVTKQPLLF